MLYDHFLRAYAAAALTTIAVVTVISQAFNPGEGGCSLRPDRQTSGACTALRPDMGDEPSDDRSLPPGRHHQQIAASSTVWLSARTSIGVFARAHAAIQEHPRANMLTLTASSE